METKQAYVVTGPTSGIGYATALELSRYGTVVLAGRNADRLQQVADELKGMGRQAVPVLCDIADINSVRRAAAQIGDLRLRLAGLVNNAGVMRTKAGGELSAQGWDMTFATNYLGAFALTEALLPHLPDGGHVVFVGSAIEDPERRPAKVLGMKGGRYISAEASARGEWAAGGSRMPGIDAYATSKLCVLAAGLALARENPRLYINVVEPGINPGTGLGSADSNAFTRALGRVMMHLPPFSRYLSTPQQAAQVIQQVLLAEPGTSGVYYDEKGLPMQGSVLSRDRAFQERVVAETRALLSRV